MKLLNRLLALVVSLTLIAVAMIVVADLIADWTGRRPAVIDWHATYRWAQRTTWDAGSVRRICLLLCLLGLALLAAELKPRRPARLVTDSEDPAIDTAYTRRGVAQAVRTAVTEVDGIDRTAVTVRRRRIRVHAHAVAREPSSASSIRESATRAARARLDALDLRRPPKLVVQISTRGR
ncbi:hypothetical protein GCM10010399_25050 [Dactylosporangium fulvum]|uniref:DUF6286 domain-containing protein n=1 Tax=Dactylosporangium fulvum TaxID=53359 RepID=A0ABY5W817_9ACTN|nr:DUF6286 domain-containing protein [Dactylosporangium fulvum]UWP85461.1 DUF6286 domain-containing protein [Dactylosporangium fulvum]